MSREPDKITGLEEQQQCFICSKHLKLNTFAQKITKTTITQKIKGQVSKETVVLRRWGVLQQHMAVYGLSLHRGSTESRKILKQKFTFQLGTLSPHGINERFSVQLIYSVKW